MSFDGTQAVRAALRKRYEGKAWALLEEVRNSTGYSRVSRSADAIAMSLWPSRGLELHGVEIKSSRNDWLRELKEPEKAEPIARYCHRWWVAVADRELVRDGELPPAWGLMALEGKKLVTVVEAPLRAVEPVGLPFLAALLRAASESVVHLRRDYVPVGEVEDRIAAALAKDDATKRKEWERAAHAELDRLRWEQNWAKDFEAQTGINIRAQRWIWGPVGELWRVFEQYGPLNARASMKLRLEGERERLGQAREKIDELLALVLEEPT